MSTKMSVEETSLPQSTFYSTPARKEVRGIETRHSISLPRYTKGTCVKGLSRIMWIHLQASVCTEWEQDSMIMKAGKQERLADRETTTGSSTCSSSSQASYKKPRTIHRCILKKEGKDRVDNGLECHVCNFVYSTYNAYVTHLMDDSCLKQRGRTSVNVTDYIYSATAAGEDSVKSAQDKRTSHQSKSELSSFPTDDADIKDQPRKRKLVEDCEEEIQIISEVSLSSSKKTENLQQDDQSASRFKGLPISESSSIRSILLNQKIANLDSIKSGLQQKNLIYPDIEVVKDSGQSIRGSNKQAVKPSKLSMKNSCSKQKNEPATDALSEPAADPPISCIHQTLTLDIGMSENESVASMEMAPTPEMARLPSSQDKAKNGTTAPTSVCQFVQAGLCPCIAAAIAPPITPEENNDDVKLEKEIQMKVGNLLHSLLKNQGSRLFGFGLKDLGPKETLLLILKRTRSTIVKEDDLCTDKCQDNNRLEQRTFYETKYRIDSLLQNTATFLKICVPEKSIWNLFGWEGKTTFYILQAISEHGINRTWSVIREADNDDGTIDQPHSI